MITIVGCNKGGASKTTTCTNLATAIHQFNTNICVVDADAQRSTAKWMGYREAEGKYPVFPLIERRDNITSTLKALNEKYDHVIVDVAGRNSKELITGAAIADLVIAPHQCSQLDLDTMGELAAQVDMLRETVNPSLRVAIYHSMASTNPMLKLAEREEFVTYLKDFPTFELLESIGYYRKIYRDAIPLGMSVIESDNENAAKEIYDLVREVYGYGA